MNVMFYLTLMIVCGELGFVKSLESSEYPPKHLLFHSDAETVTITVNCTYNIMYSHVYSFTPVSGIRTSELLHLPL